MKIIDWRWYEHSMVTAAKSRENLNQYVLALIRGQTDHRRSKLGIFKASDQKRPNWSFDETRGNLLIHAASSSTTFDAGRRHQPLMEVSVWKCSMAMFSGYRSMLSAHMGHTTPTLWNVWHPLDSTHNHFLCIAHKVSPFLIHSCSRAPVAVDFLSGNVTTPSFKVIVAASCSNVRWRNICVYTHNFSILYLTERQECGAIGMVWGYPLMEHASFRKTAHFAPRGQSHLRFPDCQELAFETKLWNVQR